MPPVVLRIPTGSRLDQLCPLLQVRDSRLRNSLSLDTSRLLEENPANYEVKAMFTRLAPCTAFLVAAAVALCHAQEPAIGVAVPPLGAGPFVLDTAEQHKMRVTGLERRLAHPAASSVRSCGGMVST